MVLIFLPLLMHEIREWLLCRTIRSENISKCVFRSRLALSRFFFLLLQRCIENITSGISISSVSLYRSIGWSWMSLSVLHSASHPPLDPLTLLAHFYPWRCSNLPNKVIILLAKFFFTSNVYTVRKNPFGVHHRIIEALMWTWKNSSFVLVTGGICGCHPVGFNYIHDDAKGKIKWWNKAIGNPAFDVAGREPGTKVSWCRCLDTRTIFNIFFD